MEIEKHLELVRPSKDTLWFFEYIKEHPEEFIDISTYSQETYVANGSVIIDSEFSDDGLTQSKKIYFKDYNVYDQWQSDPTIQMIMAKQREYDIEHGIKMNFMTIKDTTTDIVFFKRENKV